MGRGSSGMTTGKGQATPAISAKAKPGTDWREDYERALDMEKKYSDQAAAMDAEVKAAKEAYYNAPTRSKAQKEAAERLREKMDELTLKQSMLRYRAAQFSTLADNIRSENDTRYRKKRDKEASASARRSYR